jgi:hypothetical protein
MATRARCREFTAGKYVGMTLIARKPIQIAEGIVCHEFGFSIACELGFHTFVPFWAILWIVYRALGAAEPYRCYVRGFKGC